MWVVDGLRPGGRRNVRGGMQAGVTRSDPLQRLGLRLVCAERRVRIVKAHHRAGKAEIFLSKGRRQHFNEPRVLHPDLHHMEVAAAVADEAVPAARSGHLRHLGSAARDADGEMGGRPSIGSTTRREKIVPSSCIGKHHAASRIDFHRVPYLSGAKAMYPPGFGGKSTEVPPVSSAKNSETILGLRAETEMWWIMDFLLRGFVICHKGKVSRVVTGDCYAGRRGREIRVLAEGGCRNAECLAETGLAPGWTGPC